MSQFKRITLEDIDTIKPFLGDENELSCETSAVNLAVWKELYGNSFFVSDGCLFLRSNFDGDFRYALPFCDDMEKAVAILLKVCGENRPVFWAQQGGRFQRFYDIFKDSYDIIEDRDAFDYIYLRENLAALNGKKYHSKRNHISAFSKQFDWKYERITAENSNDIKRCADKWYSENEDRFDDTMNCEKKGVWTLIDNLDRLNVKGGAIRVGSDIVAFTLGSEINPFTFDIHVEKALSDYSEAYTVINKMFALNELSRYKYINREDDLGIEGLRKAKLSYKPDILLKKYTCVPREIDV